MWKNAVRHNRCGVEEVVAQEQSEVVGAHSARALYRRGGLAFIDEAFNWLYARRVRDSPFVPHQRLSPYFPDKFPYQVPAHAAGQVINAGGACVAETEA